MSKIFRLGDGPNTYKDWNKSSSFPYDSTRRDGIQDPDGATAKKEITSIPSPFARIDLVKNAFAEVCRNGNLDGDTIYHKMVSDAFDIGEIFFNINRFSDKVEIISWNPREGIEQMQNSGQEGHKLLGEALSKYLQADARTYNFDKMQNIYILNYKNGKKEVDFIGATSPVTMFFSNANNLSYLSNELSFEGDKPFDTSYRPLYKRDAQYVEALFLFRECYTGFTTAFKELNDYFDKTFEKLSDDLRNKIRALNGNNTAGHETISVQDGQNSIVEILGQPFYKAAPASIADSEFMIKSPKCNQQILVLPIDKGNRYSNLLYISEKWSDHCHAPAYDNRDIGARTLPARGDKLPYLTVSDFLEPQIIRVPYLLNETEFYTTHKRSNGEKATFLLPLKPLFFKYFSFQDIIDGNMVEVQTVSEKSAKVTLRIPILGHGQVKYIEYSRTYLSGAEPDETNNKGAVCEIKMTGFVMPNVQFRHPEEAIYKAGLVMDIKKHFELSFYCGDQPVHGITPAVRQQNSLDMPIKNAVYTINGTNFDYIQVSANGDAHGIIIPKFQPQNINNSFRFAVDLGTSNTHIEVSKDGQRSEAYSYSEPLASRFFVQTSDQYGGVENLVEENNVMEKDILPASVGDRGSDFRFPTRTILSCVKGINWSGALKCFEMHNIPLTYGKRIEQSYNDYWCNIKWGTDEKDKDMLKCYVEDLLFMLRTKVVADGGDLAKAELTWFYPLSMPSSRKEKLDRIWKEKFEEYFPGSNSLRPMSESYAPVFYYHNKQNSVSNLVNIDVGGGTTDVAYFKEKDLSFVTSFRFAANDIFQDAYTVNTEHNGIVDAYKDELKAVLEASNSDEVKEIIKIFESANNRHPANMASFLFSLRNNQQLKDVNRDKIDFNLRLQDDKRFKIVFVLFYTAIIYHIAQIIKLKGLPLPRHISLSGNGSKVIRIVSTDSKKLAYYTKKIFEGVTGKNYDNQQLDIIGLDQEAGSKESTCKGGILAQDEPADSAKKRVILKSTGEEMLDNVTFGSIDEAYKKSVEQGIDKFFEFFFSLCSKLNMKDDFDITDNSIAEAKKLCHQDIITYINRGLESQSKDYEANDPLRETLFFYPMKGFLSNLIDKL